MFRGDGTEHGCFTQRNLRRSQRTEEPGRLIRPDRELTKTMEEIAAACRSTSNSMPIRRIDCQLRIFITQSRIGNNRRLGDRGGPSR